MTTPSVSFYTFNISVLLAFSNDFLNTELFINLKKSFSWLLF